MPRSANCVRWRTSVKHVFWSAILIRIRDNKSRKEFTVAEQEYRRIKAQSTTKNTLSLNEDRSSNLNADNTNLAQERWKLNEHN